METVQEEGEVEGDSTPRSFVGLTPSMEEIPTIVGAEPTQISELRTQAWKEVERSASVAGEESLEGVVNLNVD